MSIVPGGHPWQVCRLANLRHRPSVTVVLTAWGRYIPRSALPALIAVSSGEGPPNDCQRQTEVLKSDVPTTRPAEAGEARCQQTPRGGQGDR